MSPIGPKQTCVAALHESASDPKQTWRGGLNLGATPVYENQIGAVVNLCKTGYTLAGAGAGCEFY